MAMQTYNTRNVRAAAPTENVNAKPFGAPSATLATANAATSAAAAAAAAQQVRGGATKRAALGDISNAAKLKVAAKKSVRKFENFAIFFNLTATNGFFFHFFFFSAGSRGRADDDCSECGCVWWAAGSGARRRGGCGGQARERQSVVR